MGLLGGGSKSFILLCSWRWGLSLAGTLSCVDGFMHELVVGIIFFSGATPVNDNLALGILCMEFSEVDVGGDDLRTFVYDAVVFGFKADFELEGTAIVGKDEFGGLDSFLGKVFVVPIIVGLGEDRWGLEEPEEFASIVSLSKIFPALFLEPVGVLGVLGFNVDGDFFAKDRSRDDECISEDLGWGSRDLGWRRSVRHRLAQEEEDERKFEL